MIFGATPSVSNFDRLGSMLVELAVARSGIPQHYVLRTLDYIPVLGPVGTAHTVKFGMALRGICSTVNGQLAANCPERIKAFEHVQKGTVLGICFDTKAMEWFLNREKADKFLSRVIDTLHMDYIGLKQQQKVMGVLNDLSLMCSFMKPYKASGYKLLHELGTDEEMMAPVSFEFKQDLGKFARMIQDARQGLPVAARPTLPPLMAKS
jgi:hypothetical protein